MFDITMYMWYTVADYDIALIFSKTFVGGMYERKRVQPSH